MKTARKVTGVNEHIYFNPKPGYGRAKTVCTSHVLAAFHVPPTAYHYSGTVAQRCAILRKHGWAVRSRNSHTKKCKTVGQVRRLIEKTNAWSDPSGTRYMLRVKTGAVTHAILLNDLGDTIVDTAPRKVDRRQVLDVRAVFRNTP